MTYIFKTDKNRVIDHKPLLKEAVTGLNFENKFKSFAKNEELDYCFVRCTLAIILFKCL
jgi:hypothetical protein